LISDFSKIARFVGILGYFGIFLDFGHAFTILYNPLHVFLQISSDFKQESISSGFAVDARKSKGEFRVLEKQIEKRIPRPPRCGNSAMPRF